MIAIVQFALVTFGTVALVAPQLAPLRYMDTDTLIKGEYIVVFKKDVEDFELDVHKNAVRKMLTNETSMISREYHIGKRFRGYAAKLTDEEVKQIQAMTQVHYIAANQVVKLSQSCLLQTGATWGIVRTTQRDNIPGEPYQYENSDGEGVSVYVIDTGLYIEHNEFGGRASYGFDSVSNPPLYRDGNGHGTHVASTIIGQEYGLARKATAIGVRVLGDNGAGTTDGVIAGIDWTAAEHEKNNNKKSVANMSLGGGKYDPVDDVVDAAVEQGVHFTISAGGSNSDACNHSPAASELSLTVGSTDSQDKRSGFSNYGKCVDIFAPGSSIMGAWIGSPSATSTLSGTSMAAPHVAGVMAKLLSKRDYTPKDLKIFVKAISTKDKIENIPDDESPNELVFADCES